MIGTNEAQLIIAVLTMIGSGVMCYIGVRVALAEIRGDVKRHDEQISDMSDRIVRLENEYFVSMKK